MTSSISSIAAWTFVAECPVPHDIGPLLVEGEQPIAAYKTFRDSAIFTTKRLIVAQQHADDGSAGGVGELVDHVCAE